MSESGSVGRGVVAAFALGFAVALLTAEPAAACPLCKGVLDSEAGRVLAGGLRNGTYVLVAAPIATVAGIGWLIRRRSRLPLD